MLHSVTALARCFSSIFSYPALGLCQIASGFSVRSGSEPNVEPTRWLFSLICEPRLLTSSTLPSDAERAWEECCSLTEFSNSVRYLKYTSLCRKLGKNTWNVLKWSSISSHRMLAILHCPNTPLATILHDKAYISSVDNVSRRHKNVSSVNSIFWQVSIYLIAMPRYC